MINSKEVENLFSNTPQERWPQMVNTVVVDCLKQHEGFAAGAKSRINNLLQRVSQLENVIKMAMEKFGGAVPPGAVEAVEGAEAEAAPEAAAPAGPVVGADGSPLSATQLDVEAAMDRAISDAPVVPQPRSRPAPASNGNGGGRRQRAQAPPQPQQTMVGADGQPLSPEQAAIERQMDEASV